MGRLWLWVIVVAVTFTASACSKPSLPPAREQFIGDYGPLTADQLRGVHSVFATGTSDAKFIWEFTAERFKVSGDGGSIPTDALVAVLGDRQPAEAIEGRWTLDNQVLALTGITADGKDGYDNVTLYPFPTPFVRMDLNGTQYVFRSPHSVGPWR
jgi:hypothetical protein